MRGIYVLSYPKSDPRIIEKMGFKRRGIRFHLYVAIKKIKGEKIEIIDYRWGNGKRVIIKNEGFLIKHR